MNPTWGYCWWPWGGTRWSWRCCVWLGQPAPVSSPHRWLPGCCHSALPLSPESARRILAAGGSLRKHANITKHKRVSIVNQTTQIQAGTFVSKGTQWCYSNLEQRIEDNKWTTKLHVAEENGYHHFLLNSRHPFLQMDLCVCQEGSTHTSAKKQPKPCSEPFKFLEIISLQRGHHSGNQLHHPQAPCPHLYLINKHPRKLPVVHSPPPSPVLVQKLRGWQHDVKLNRCPRRYQILWFWSCPCLGTTSEYTSWLCSAGMRGT